jgi:hypothetical protein
MLYHRFIYKNVIVIFLTVSFSAVTWLEKPVNTCDVEAALLPHRAIYRVHPSKVVIKPWHGWHHVYAIFTIPGDHNIDKVTLNIPGLPQYCGAIYVSSHAIDGIEPKQGYYIVQSHLNTRTTLWLFSQGFAAPLKQPFYWTAFFSKIERAK